MRHDDGHLGLPSGVGLVAGNMVGAGVFLSAGFMAQDMGPGAILLAWVIGAVIALAGARAYAAVAAWVPRSGGEYRYLSDLFHPALGYLAGWASLLLGFSAPLAVDALAAGSFAKTIVPGIDQRLFGFALVISLTALHASSRRSSKWTQNLIVALDVLLLTGFVAVGLTLGHHQWPAWTPPNASDGFPFGPLVKSLFFIAFAFSGWNAAAYAAQEFRRPERDVPRAMLIGCAAVAVLYLVVNWVFVANLTPARAQVVFEYESTRVTLGHVVVRDLLGPAAGASMSLLAMVAFVAAASAMTIAGPRVYAAMAKDGYLPRVLAGEDGRPPVAAVVLQGILALVLMGTHTLQQVLLNVGAILTLFSALTCLAVFRVRFFRPDLPPPSVGVMAAAALHVAAAVLMLYFGFHGSTRLLAWLAVVGAVTVGAYAVTRALRVDAPEPDAA